MLLKLAYVIRLLLFYILNILAEKISFLLEECLLCIPAKFDCFQMSFNI